MSHFIPLNLQTENDTLRKDLIRAMKERDTAIAERDKARASQRYCEVLRKTVAKQEEVLREFLRALRTCDQSFHREFLEAWQKIRGEVDL